jgi:hypothetical protein
LVKKMKQRITRGNDQALIDELQELWENDFALQLREC